MNHQTHDNSEPNGGICVTVALADTDSAISAITPLTKDIDVVEIRLDAMEQISIPKICRDVSRPLLFTNRAAWEGGLCSKPEEERLSLLREAVRQQAAFVDLELATPLQYREQLLSEISDSTTRLIISHHDFAKTPDSDTLSAVLREQIASGAHIGKIVTMAHSYLDVLRVLHLQCEARNRNFPLIAFCMGEEGKLSRIVTLFLGGFMTYAAIDEQHAAAPGQLSVYHLKEAIAHLSCRKSPV